ncbi:hypothetical protein BC830DRAFT_1170766 [Chytriomyces sp. MP71]|nr:hypothetical protein BC830DRAFT_1170766 [Chytriomyces sp. MP71]
MSFVRSVGLDAQQLHASASDATSEFGSALVDKGLIRAFERIASSSSGRVLSDAPLLMPLTCALCLPGIMHACMIYALRLSVP